MSRLKEKKPLLEKLKNKYRLTISNEGTFDEVLSIRLSRLNVFTVTGLFSIILIALVTLLIAFTPLREYIPGYPDGEMRKNIEDNAILADSLIAELDKRDRFFQGIRNVISGNDFDNVVENADDSIVDPKYKDLSFSISSNDSAFRKEHEEDEKYNLSLGSAPKARGLSNTYFFAPINGMVSNHYDSKIEHFGTDIVGGLNERISSVLDGTVVFSEWTLNTGYVIQIQHSNNLLSVYKHNSELLKKTGEHVKAGEAIALLGNSGELTSGPHLHFELWHNGQALNPEDYIKF
ncbi:M23 family metallopeptidase [Labilibaculum manganireducens]|uniref:Peptidase M23 n=1 Tax=Labilibaculum manganireducens TaxID=1940525 RepID=A0A2N3I7T2_9BACT|nr:M23 family metallopeptidase [Labilibaculum manganireducens]PKQ66358.1 peptidase M23 [Labilibaculum manganireducens]